MVRNRRGVPVHGWIIIDKPLGISSTGVVGKVRYLLNAQKAGHGGTLDPLASGILPIALGEATKVVSYAMDGSKTYEFTVRWGQSTATDDMEGIVVAETDVRPTETDILDILSEFEGEIEQVPPMYSAIKVDGKRAYDLARADIAVKLKPRKIKIDKLTLVNCDNVDHASFRVQCGKGTYIRSLARDIGVRLGTRAYVSRLRRTAVGSFTEKDAISLDSLEKLGHNMIHSKVLLAVEAVLDDIPAIALSANETRRLTQGQAIFAAAMLDQYTLKDLKPDAVICALFEGEMIALVKYVGGEIKALRVLNR
jgi:tRNA pseudouridine55 synthase